MDIKMPGLDGRQAVREIREIERETGARRVAIVALTANATAEDRRAALDAGVDEYLVKPFDPPKLAETDRARARPRTADRAGAATVIISSVWRAEDGVITRRRLVDMAEQALLARAGDLEVRLAAGAARDRGGAGAALPRVLRGGRGRAGCGEPAQRAATSAGSTKSATTSWPSTGGRSASRRRRLSAAAAGGRGCGASVSTARREFEVGAADRAPSRPALHGTRPLLRRRGLSRQADDGDALARRLGLCAAASASMSMFGCASLPGADAAAHAAALGRALPAIAARSRNGASAPASQRAPRRAARRRGGDSPRGAARAAAAGERLFAARRAFQRRRR